MGPKTNAKLHRISIYLGWGHEGEALENYIRDAAIEAKETLSRYILKHLKIAPLNH